MMKHYFYLVFDSRTHKSEYRHGCFESIYTIFDTVESSDTTVLKVWEASLDPVAEMRSVS